MFCHSCGHQAYTWPDSCTCDLCQLRQLLARVLQLDKLQESLAALVDAKQKETAERIGNYMERIDKEMDRRIAAAIDKKWTEEIEKEVPL